MLYMPFSDMRNFVAMLPEDKRKDIEADFDSLRATVQGFNVGVRVAERVPYSRITYKDDGAPFQFNVNIHFDADGGNPDSTDFHIDITADLNFMMKMVLGSKLQSVVDKMVDTVADMSEGKCRRTLTRPCSRKDSTLLNLPASSQSQWNLKGNSRIIWRRR